MRYFHFLNFFFQNKARWGFFFLVLCVVYCLSTSSGFEYEVHIEGQTPPFLRQIIHDASLLYSKKLNLETQASLQRQIEKDADEMVTRAKSFGYLDAKVTVKSVEKDMKTSIRFHIMLGERFRLGTIGFFLQDPTNCTTCTPSEKDIPSFRSKTYVDGEQLQVFEQELIYSLACRGYPNAKVLEITYTPDPSKKILNIFYSIQINRYTTFGPVTVTGNDKVRSAYLLSKIPFREGDEYNKRILDETEQKLLQTGILLSSSFEGTSQQRSDSEMPLTLHVQEGKLHAIGGGVSYMTTLGPGASALYEDRYMGDDGQKMVARIDAWQKKQQGILSLTYPSFHDPKQNLLWIVEADHQTYLPYHSSAEKLSCMLEKTWTKYIDTVIGLRLEQLRSSHLLADRKNELAKIPFQLKISNTDSFMDPTKGALFNMRLTPSAQYVRPIFSYLIQLSSLSFYTSGFDNKLTFACKGTFGNIIGSRPNKIPLPDRFYGGSDSMLRGYKMGTVSPRNKKGELIGGDSLLAGSFEFRIRQKKNLGWVMFYDVGDVYKKRYANKSLHFLHSIGAGTRYSTPIGPLRLDIAFPMNRRKHIDPFMQLYFSIGQAF